MDEVYAYLKERGKQIGREAKAGDKLSLEICKLYKMHYVCPGDPGAQGVLQALIDKHRRRQP